LKNYSNFVSNKNKNFEKVNFYNILKFINIIFLLHDFM